MFQITDPAQHDRVKAKLSPAYSGRDAPNLEAVVNRQIGSLIQLIKEKYTSAQGDYRPMEGTRVTRLFALDVISNLSLGQEFGYLKADSDFHGIVKALNEHMLVMTLATDIPWLRNLIFSPMFLKLFGPTENDTKGIGPLMKVANTIVRERYAPEADEQHDMLAVIYEGIRIRPATLGMFFKDVPAGGETMHGKYIPAGTSIGINASSLLRSEALFGPDPQVFRPERYLEVDKETSAQMKRDVEIVFGYGRWMCAGKPIAFMELNKVIFESQKHTKLCIVIVCNSLQDELFILKLSFYNGLRALLNPTVSLLPFHDCRTSWLKFMVYHVKQKKVKMVVHEIHSMEEFKDALEKHPLVLVDFWATWSGPCQLISPVIEKHSDSSRYSSVYFC
ncbi:hypothetical protein FOXG_09111 [Fusarium oxysporum f. sp. lycopersici 4287]|uniref:Thioredoxin domain-containing protein n=2 Tax=Fusarium oxysporum TaxID=5507 RepID=A0A0J9VAG3_FUSO4|nr:hypothetical protein FOXG_09111 [Fusarium oxysporum f. sp. lycopersici 4287]KNB08113.1 hypothetical protein FOXG_09111 [Fusarium oxysporum f. sp. lycopersici 4287]